MRRSFALLALLSLAGCWPRIPGSWDDYATPEETQIIGMYSWYEYQGAYWSDDTDYGVGWFAWLQEPDPDVTAMTLFHTSTAGCMKGTVDIDWLTARFADAGAGQAQLEHDGERVDLPWDGELNVFFSDALEKEDVVQDTPYDLVALPLMGKPAYSEGFVMVPPALAMEGPEIDGEVPATVNPEDLAWTWSPAEAQNQKIVVEAFLVDDANDTLESVVCIADGSDGSIAVTPTFWDDLDQGDGWYVFLQNYRESHTRIETELEGVGSARMAGVRGKVGFLGLN
jgi:hypothetical protein